MNFFRPKLFMSLMLIAMLGFATVPSMAQDIGIGDINVHPDGATGHQPILLDTEGTNTIDVYVTNYDAANVTSATFTVDLEISWPNQVGGPLVLTKTMTPTTTIAQGESYMVSWTGTDLDLNNFYFDRRIIYTLDARVYGALINPAQDADGNAGNDRLSDMMDAVCIAPAFNVPMIEVDPDPLNGAEFTNFAYMGEYLTYAGLTGDLEVKIASGVHNTSATMSLDGDYFTTDNAYTITFSGRKNYPALVEITAPTRDRVNDGEPWMWKIKEFNTLFKDITLTVDHTPAMDEGGQALFLENSSTMTVASYHHEIHGCVFNGVATPEAATNDFNVIHCDGNYLSSFKFYNNRVNMGYIGLYIDNDADPTPEGIVLEFTDNKFIDFTNGGLYVARPAVTTPVDYSGGLFTGNVFQTGSFDGYALYTSNMSIIRNNTFNLVGAGGSAVAIFVQHDPAYETPAYIENNIIDNGLDIDDNWLISSAGMGGIYVTTPKKAFIRDNTIGINNAIDQFGIYVNGGGLDLVENYTNITGNTVDMRTNGSAVTIEGGAFTKMYYNELMACSPASGTARWMISTNASTGIVANNMCSSTFSEGIMSTNDVNMNFFYNTIDIMSGTANTDVAFTIDGGNATVKRNMVVNHGTNAASYSVAITNAPTLVIDENNYYSFGANFGLDIDGVTPIATIANWRTFTGDDAASTNAPVIYDTEGRLIYEFFDDDDDSTTVGPYGGYTAGVYSGIYYADPLFDITDPLHMEFEKYNFYGEERRGYYAGNINLVPQVTIVTQPVDVTSCLGEDHLLQVVANVSHQAKPWYQWYKDGELMVGETTAILLLNDIDWSDAASYQCVVSGQGGTEPLETYDVLVVAVGKSRVTRQPMNQAGKVGASLMFEVEAHIRGFEDDPDNELNQPLIQWFFYDGNSGVALEDSEDHEYNVVAGSKSSILTISNISEDAWANEYKYYARLLGFCDYDEDGDPVYIYTDTVAIMAPPSLSIDQEPQSQELCEGEELVLEVAYTTEGEVEDVQIQWMHDGVEIAGANMEQLTIDPVTPADAGLYSVDLTLFPGGEVYTSTSATITVNEKPAITMQPIDVEVDEGNPFELSVEAEGYGTLTYAWYKDDVEIDGAESMTFSVAAAATEDAGIYYCIVSNECGDTQSANATVIVNEGGEPGEVIESAAGDIHLLTNTPNPFTESTDFKVVLPAATQIRIVLSDMYGREVAVIADGTFGVGTSIFTVNADELNLNSGVYNYTLTAGNRSITKQMILTK